MRGIAMFLALVSLPASMALSDGVKDPTSGAVTRENGEIDVMDRHAPKSKEDASREGPGVITREEPKADVISQHSREGRDQIVAMGEGEEI